MFKIRLACSLMLIAVLSGCSSLEAPSYSPNYQVLDSIKTKDLKDVSLGNFQPMDPEAKVNHISLRGSSLNAKQGTFVEYLKQALKSDLQEMGIYNQNSDISIDATMLENDIDVSGISRGYGRLTVKLIVKNAGNVVFDKVYDVNTDFESSFAAAIALPKAQAEYPVLVKTLLGEVYQDKKFIEVLSK